MRQFLAIVGPTVFTFGFWGVITVIPMNSLILLALVIISGVFMLFSMAYLGKISDKNR